MPNTSPPTLERAAGGLALLTMLALFALTIGAPADAAPAPVIIVATPALDTGPILSPQLQAPERQAPPPVQDVLPAQKVPAPAAPPAQEVPAVEALPLAVVDAAPATAATRPSQLIVEPDGTVRLPGVENWMANLPPEPTATPRPTAIVPLPPRGGCAARRGCP